MNILFVGYMYGRGGIQTHSHFLATGLSERGHKVTVATPKAIHGHNSAYSHNPNGAYEIIEYHGLRDFNNKFSSRPARSFDLVQVCGTGYAAMLGALLIRHCRARTFFEVMSGKPYRNIDPRWLVHFGFDAIIGQASVVEKNFRHCFRWGKKSTFIPALPEPLERYIKIPERGDINSGKLRGVYFGRLANHKGINFLLQQWGVLSNVLESIDIFGTGPDELAIRSKIAAMKLGKVIRLCGDYPTGTAYVALMQQYDLKLLPTTGDEGAPLVLLEAMAAGLPFVANGVGGIPDYSNPDCEITSGDISEFVPAVMRFARRVRGREISPVRLQRHYRDFFSFEQLCNRWEKFFLEITGIKPERITDSLPATSREV